MGTKCAPLLADLFLYSYEAEFVQKLLQDNNKKLAVLFNHTFRYIDDVLSINNHNFHNYVHLISGELEIKDTTESDKSASYLDILLKGIVSKLTVKFWMCQKRGKMKDYNNKKNDYKYCRMITNTL
jgi:hypothetical protein